jgi:D-cysteine desulfhydrase
VELGSFPTPLQPEPRLSERLGVTLSVKREDLAGLADGGNKVRKLEYVCAAPGAQAADVWITVGSQQSNHARELAAAAARFGKRAELVLTGKRPRSARGNLGLAALFGARLTFTGLEDLRTLERVATRRARELRAEGASVYEIPLGAATWRGAAAWVHAADELLAQREGAAPEHVVLAAGTGSTAAGLALGLAAAGARTTVWAASVAFPRLELEGRVALLQKETARMLGLPAETCVAARAALRCDDAQLGAGYGAGTPQGRRALRHAAHDAGLVLDLTYSAKGFAHLIALCARDRGIPAGADVLFLHTGGAAANAARAPHDLGRFF